MRFVYSLIRFVPDPARGEFINVGAIAGSEESSEWQIRQIENPSRARRLDDAGVLDAVWSFIDRVGSEIDAHDESVQSLFGQSVEIGEEWLRRLQEDHRNVVQLSPPAPIVAENADDALNRVFDLMVLEPDHRKIRFEKKYAALAAMQRAYSDRGIKKGQDYRDGVGLQTDGYSRQRIDFAVTNGRVLQLAQTWSFQVPNQEAISREVEAWGWLMQATKRNGAIATTARNEQFEVQRDVDIEVVYVPPREGESITALNDAKSVFADLRIESRPMDQAAEVAERAHQLLIDAGTGKLPIGNPSRRSEIEKDS